MSYRGVKWLKFKFVIHPTEFKEIFKSLNCFEAVTNRRVEENYKVTDTTAIVDVYKLYYNKIISGCEWRKEDWRLEMYTQITDDPKLVKFETFEIKEENQIKKYKKAIQIEPVINISPFGLSVHKEKLSVAFLDSSRNSYLGIELSYPREITYLENQNIVLTETFSTFQLYKEIAKRIKKQAKKAKASWNGKIQKPDFWISPKALAEINNNNNLKYNAIVLI